MDAVGAGAPLLFLSFAIGWGGLCVHFQVLSAASKIGISRLRFTLFRLLHGILAAFLTNLFFRLFPVTVSVFSSTSQPLSGKLSGSAPAAAVLFLLCMAFLLSCLLYTSFPNQIAVIFLPKCFGLYRFPF